MLGNGEALNIVEEIVYEPRGISDHSPVVIGIKVGKWYSRGDWKVNPFWLEIVEDTGTIMDGLAEFIRVNLGTAPLGIVWDSLKAFLRGVPIQKISYAKKQSQVKRVKGKREGKKCRNAVRGDTNPN